MVPIRRALAAGSLGLASGFSIGCGADMTAPEAPTLVITASTSGPEPDLDGFVISLDGGPARALGLNATLTLTDVSPGEHQVLLAGIAPNCTVAGENPRGATLMPGNAARMTFVVSCTASTGSLTVHTVTSGDGLDPNGYAMSLDGNPTRPLGLNGGVTISALAPGEHRVDISDVVSNCTVGGGSSRTVTVSAGALVELTMEIACTGRSIHVTTVTSGSAPDVDGYAISVDGSAGRAIGPNGSLEIGGLIDGDHELLLAGVAPFCNPGLNPRTVQAAAAAASALFEIVCPGPPTHLGRILYSRPVGGRIHLFAVRPDGAANVDLTPTTSGSGGKWSPNGSRIAFESMRNGESEVWVMRADGSKPVRLAAGQQPAWSPDGSQIAFVRDRNLLVMDAGGADVRQVTAGEWVAAPSWSPDGARIAYSARNTSKCALFLFDPVCAWDIYTVSVGGGDRRQVTNAPDALTSLNSPAWSPDGATIAYWRGYGFGVTAGDLYLIAPDGSNQIQLTATEDITEAFPVWSPDGSALAFATAASRTGELDIALMSPQGGPPVPVRSAAGEEVPNSWR